MQREVKLLLMGVLVLLLSVSLAFGHLEEDDIPGGEPHPEESCPPEGCETALHPVVVEKLGWARNWGMIAGMVGAVLILGWQFLLNKKKGNREKIKQSAIWIVSLVVLIGLLYSVYYVKITGAESEGIKVCKGGQCFLALHIHSQLDLEVCGESIIMEKEEGDLGELHTHKELNLIHFHEKLPMDADGKEVTDWSQLKLGKFFEAMEFPFSSQCFGKYCNGDACSGGTEGKVHMWVNNKPNEEFEHYVWKDGDEIKIVFG